jgi:hypothetical protein
MTRDDCLREIKICTYVARSPVAARHDSYRDGKKSNSERSPTCEIALGKKFEAVHCVLCNESAAAVQHV